MIRSLYRAARQRRLNRQGTRLMAKILKQQRAGRVVDIKRVEAMAFQLAEIRALPEALRRRA